MMYNNGFWGHGFMNSGWSWLIGIGVILLVASVIYLLVKRNNNQTTESKALETLKMRYANGEISEEEYLKLKKIISEK